MASKKPTPLTLEEHHRLGARLKEMREELMGIGSDLYGIIPSGIRNRMFRGIDSVFAIRVPLEAAMFRDFPKEGTTKVYYGAVAREETNNE